MSLLRSERLCALISLICLVCSAHARAQDVTAVPITLSSNPNESTVEEQMQKLAQRFSVHRKMEAPLKDLLDWLHEQRSVNFRVNRAAFQDLEPPLENVGETRIELAPLTNTRLDSVLTYVLRNVNGTCLVRRDHLEITTLKEACRECGGPWPGFDVDLDWNCDQSFFADFRLPFVQLSFKNRPLGSIFAELMTVYNDQNIVFAPQAATRMKVPVTGRLLNVPLNQALTLLAKLGDLEAVTCGKITLITTAEKASPMLKDLAERRMVRRVQLLLQDTDIYVTPEQLRVLLFPAPAGSNENSARCRARISWDDYARNVLEKQAVDPDH
jgi:hypothetical protein